MHLTNIIDKFSYDQQRLNINHNLKISTAQYQVHLDVVLLLHFHNSIINCVKFSMTTTNYCYLFDTVAGLFITMFTVKLPSLYQATISQTIMVYMAHSFKARAYRGYGITRCKNSPSIITRSNFNYDASKSLRRLKGGA